MTTVATRAGAIGQDFTGSEIIETAGFSAKGDGGEGRYYLIDPATYTGAPADAGPGTIECANGWYRLMGATLYIEQFGASGLGADAAAADGSAGFDSAPAINAAIAFANASGASRVSARTKGQFGVGAQIVIDSDRLTFGNGLSPFSMALVALTTNSFMADEGIIELVKNRTSIDGVWLRIPTGVYDPVTDTGTRVSGLRTRNATEKIFHNRIWNAEVVGGYKSFHIEGFEGDLRKTRAFGPYAYGYHVTGADTEFSPSCTATEGDVGFYTSAGVEGAMHCVRNRINFHFDSGLPNRMFCFDDTALETGIWCDNMRGAHLLTYHMKTGQHAQAVGPVHYLKMERCRANTIENVGVYRAQDDATLAVSAQTYFLDIPAEWQGDPWTTIRNRFLGYRLDEVEMARDADTLRRVARNTFLGCEGKHVARLAGDNHQLTGAGENLIAGGTARFERFLTRRPGGEGSHVLRVLGRAIVSVGPEEDALFDLSLRVPISEGDATEFTGTATVRERERSGAEEIQISVSDVVYDAADNCIAFDLTGPAMFPTKCEVVLTDVLCDNGGF